MLCKIQVNYAVIVHYFFKKFTFNNQTIISKSTKFSIFDCDNCATIYQFFLFAIFLKVKYFIGQITNKAFNLLKKTVMLQIIHLFSCETIKTD
jgi:hypothetical protein